MLKPAASINSPRNVSTMKACCRANAVSASSLVHECAQLDASSSQISIRFFFRTFVWHRTSQARLYLNGGTLLPVRLH